MKSIASLLLFLFISTSSFAQKTKSESNRIQKATFGAGCFWCTEAVFQRIKGVTNVKSGYEGGNVPNPSYQEVCTGETGHAEVIELEYDPLKVSYDELLEVFWKTHDPTTLNRQGADVGTQYRSVIFYHSEQQKATAEKYKDELNKTNAFGNKVVTVIEKAKPFYVAENYHQDYYLLNGEQPYCKAVILPKMEKMEKIFKTKLKN